MTRRLRAFACLADKVLLIRDLNSQIVDKYHDVDDKDWIRLKNNSGFCR